MSNFNINEMLEMQKALQEKYKNLWKPIGPDRGQDQLLWMIGEIGEVIDIVKKERRRESMSGSYFARTSHRRNGRCSYVLQRYPPVLRDN